MISLRTTATNITGMIVPPNLLDRLVHRMVALQRDAKAKHQEKCGGAVGDVPNRSGGDVADHATADEILHGACNLRHCAKYVWSARHLSAASAIHKVPSCSTLHVQLISRATNDILLV